MIMFGYSLGITSTHANLGLDRSSSEIISAVVAPATSPLVAGQSVDAVTDYAAMVRLTNFRTTAPGGTIASVVVTATDDAATVTQPLAEGDVAGYSVRVEDTAGNARTFVAPSITVPYIAPVATGAIGHVTCVQAVAMTPLDVAGYFTGTGISYELAPSSAALPDGLELSDAGVMSGTPTDTADARTIVVRATNTGGFVDQGFSLDVVEVSAGLSVRYGPDADFVGPTTGDFFVATDGADSNVGTSEGAPFATLQAAIDAADAAGGSRTILMRGGTYRQKADLEGTNANITLARYGNERPVVSAADLLTGWTACDASDQAEVGDSFASLYKTTIALADLEHGKRELLNLYEDGVRCDIAQDRLIDTSPHAWDDDGTYHTGTFNVSGGNKILSITDATVLAGYTEEQARDLTVAFYNADNRSVQSTFSAFDTGAATGTLTDQTRTVHASGAAGNRYSLINSPRAITRGRWACRSNLDGATATVYFWPNDPANLAAGIEYSTRTHVLDIANMQGDFTARGIDMIRAAESGIGAGVCFGNRTYQNTDRPGAVDLQHCHFGQSTGDNYGAIYLKKIGGGTSIKNCRIEETTDHGMQITECDGTHLDQIDFHKVSGSPIRAFTNLNFIWSFSRMVDVARNTHANLFPFYQGGDNCLLYGLFGRDVFGYITWSVSSRIALAFNDIEVNGVATDGRAIVNQNGGGDPPSLNSRFYFYNNATRPNSTTQAPSSFSMGTVAVDEDYTVLNNLFDGLSDPNGVLDDQRGNVYSALNSAQRERNLIPSEAFQNAEEMYVSPYGGDWTPRAGSIVRQRVGVDLTASIAALQALHPSFEHFDKDLNGATFDATLPPTGPEAVLPDAPGEAPYPYAPVNFTPSKVFDFNRYLGWEDTDGFTLAMRVTRPVGGSGNIWLASNLYNTYVLILNNGRMRVKVRSRAGDDLYFNTGILANWEPGQTKSLVVSASGTRCQFWLDGDLMIDETLPDAGGLRTYLTLNGISMGGSGANTYDLHALWYANTYIDAARAAAVLFDADNLPTGEMQAGGAIDGVDPLFAEARALGWDERDGMLTVSG